MTIQSLRKRLRSRSLRRQAAMACGMAAIVIGVALVFVPAGFVAAGILLVLQGIEVPE